MMLIFLSQDQNMPSKITEIVLETEPGLGISAGTYEQYRVQQNEMMAPHLRGVYERSMSFITAWERELEIVYDLPYESCRGFHLLFKTPQELIQRLADPDILTALKDPGSRITALLGGDISCRGAWIIAAHGTFILAEVVVQQ
jgi:hypothetical protein